MVVWISWFLAGLLPAAILIDNYTSATNDRFQSSDSPDEFWLAGYDLSGVGQASDGRWATLIGSNTILSANHFRPSGLVTFYPGNSGAATPVQLTITTDALRIAGTDLWLARLSGHVPDSIAVYDYATAAISQPGPGDSFVYEGEVMAMTGRSPASFPATRDQAYGSNVVSDFLEDQTVSGLGNALDVLVLDYNSGPAATLYEAFLQSGDSGAPLFADNGSGGLTLLGINSYIATSGGNPVASYVSYTGNASAQITSQVAEWAAVPEPAILLFLLLGGAAFAIARRASRKPRAQRL